MFAEGRILFGLELIYVFLEEFELAVVVAVSVG
jgi:hypothetical protein